MGLDNIPLSEPSQEQKEVFFMTMEELKNEFILDCKARNLAPRTIGNFEKQLNYFVRFLEERQDVKKLEELFHL